MHFYTGGRMVVQFLQAQNMFDSVYVGGPPTSTIHFWFSSFRFLFICTLERLFDANQQELQDTVVEYFNRP